MRLEHRKSNPPPLLHLRRHRQQPLLQRDPLGRDKRKQQLRHLPDVADSSHAMHHWRRLEQDHAGACGER